MLGQDTPAFKQVPTMSIEGKLGVQSKMQLSTPLF